MNFFRRQILVALTGAMLLAGGAVFGQSEQPRNNVFGTLAFVGGTHLGARAALDFKMKSEWSVGLTCGFFTGYARDLPDDYSQRYIGGPYGGGPKTLKDAGQYGAITIGRNVVLNPSWAWHSRIGPSLSSIGIHENFRLVPVSYSANLFVQSTTLLYDSDKIYHFPVGMYVASAIEFSSKSGTGVTIGFSANLNPVRTSFGFDFGVLFGKHGTWSYQDSEPKNTL